MKGYKHKIGATLVEILIVVAIIAILATMVVGIATRISNQSKEQLTKNTFALLNAALGQFRDYKYNGLGQALGTALGLAPGSISIDLPVHDPNYSGSEALYFFLNRVPTSRQTLRKIDDSLITNLSANKQSMEIEIDFLGGLKKTFPLLRIIDPWGTTLHYDYYNEWDFNYARRNKGKRTFPEIISAGPDRIFGTGDDITSR